MNSHALAAEIVTKIRASLGDSVLNQCSVVEGMIREAMDAELEHADTVRAVEIHRVIHSLTSHQGS